MFLFLFLPCLHGLLLILTDNAYFPGNLALSRAIGDFEFKSNTSLEAEKQIVTADPEITLHEPTPEDEFVVIACDG